MTFSRSILPVCSKSKIRNLLNKIRLTGFFSDCLDAITSINLERQRLNTFFLMHHKTGEANDSPLKLVEKWLTFKHTSLAGVFGSLVEAEMYEASLVVWSRHLASSPNLVDRSFVKQTMEAIQWSSPQWESQKIRLVAWMKIIFGGLLVKVQSTLEVTF